MIGPSARLNSSSHSHPFANAPYPGTDSQVVAKGTALRVTQGAGPLDMAGRRAPATDGQRSAAPAPDLARREPTPSGDVCRLLSLLADRTRLRILRILAGGERPVVSLTSELRLPQPTVSHHLAWLRMMDLVSPRRQGKHVFYTLGPAAQCDDAGVLTLTADDATVTITPYAGG